MKLPGDVVHLWLSGLAQLLVYVERLRDLLSDQEEERLDLIYFHRHQSRYFVDQGVLRRILVECLGIVPLVIRVEYGSQGKPMEPSDMNERRIDFNHAHCRTTVGYGLARERWIGVNVQCARGISDLEQVARYFVWCQWDQFWSMPGGVCEDW